MKISKSKMKEILAAERKRFSKANRMRKRVMIARDVLAQISAGKMIVTQGTYLILGDNRRLEEKDQNKELCDLLSGVKCEVCAIGAAFVSGVKFKDKLKVNEASPPWSGDLVIDDHKMTEYLSGIFTEEEMREFERIFEGFGYDYANPFKASVREHYVHDPEMLLTMIMHNIIATGGRFDSQLELVWNEKFERFDVPGFKG